MEIVERRKNANNSTNKTNAGVSLANFRHLKLTDISLKHRTIILVDILDTIFRKC